MMEEFLPLLFTSFESDGAQRPNLENGTVDALDRYDYDHIVAKDTLPAIPVMGINDLEGWDYQLSYSSGGYVITGSYLYSSTQSGLNENYLITVSAGNDAYEQYIGRSNYGNGAIVERQKVGETETPFGKAVLYYMKKCIQDSEEVLYYREVEAAVLKTNDAYIVIAYENKSYDSSDRFAGNYDGQYDGKLEELLPELLGER